MLTASAASRCSSPALRLLGPLLGTPPLPLPSNEGAPHTGLEMTRGLGRPVSVATGTAVLGASGSLDPLALALRGGASGGDTPDTGGACTVAITITQAA